MSKVYKYKRVGFRKLVLILSIVAIVMLSFFLATMPQIEMSNIIGLIVMICCCSVLLHSAYRKYYVTVEDGILKIINTAIPATRMKKIDVKEKRIDILVEKGTFLLGTHINITDACFYSTQDWNNFKQDIENLKTLIIQ